ncbi:MAG: sigma-54-dependent transcriptional regulator [Planctomycetota bacterium]|jgi:DNA-binding NtrC family response regulator
MTEENILVVDDDKPLLDIVELTLSRAGFSVSSAGTWQEAETLAEKEDFALFLLDYKMPEVNGIELMKKLRRIRPQAESIIITGYPTVDHGVEAIREGARDYISKPVESDELVHRINTALEAQRLRADIFRKDLELQDRNHFDKIFGVSKKMLDVRELGRKAALGKSGVLIEGESGTGKELLAKAIHYTSSRSGKPFVAVNCGAIAPTIAEREFFGHVKGSFTGAHETQKGYFEAANGGTLFLDEIGELVPELQVKLLRALDNREISRIGSTESIPLDVRMLYATNRNLKFMVQNNTFRQDLFYRINVLRIFIPPLRDRREDIRTITAGLIRNICKTQDTHPRVIAEDALQVLENYDWPGNVRELENTIEQAIALNESETIELEDLPDTVLGRSVSLPVSEKKQDFMSERRKAGEEFDKRYISAALLKNNYNISQTARTIGIARSALQRFMRKYNIKTLKAEGVNSS